MPMPTKQNHGLERRCHSSAAKTLAKMSQRQRYDLSLDIMLLQSGIVYLSTAETVLSLLLRHSENILRLICLKLLLSPPSNQRRV